MLQMVAKVGAAVERQQPLRLGFLNFNLKSGNTLIAYVKIACSPVILCILINSWGPAWRFFLKSNMMSPTCSFTNKVPFLFWYYSPHVLGAQAITATPLAKDSAKKNCVKGDITLLQGTVFGIHPPLKNKDGKEDLWKYQSCFSQIGIWIWNSRLQPQADLAWFCQP